MTRTSTNPSSTTAYRSPPSPPARALKRYRRACRSFDALLDTLHSLVALMAANGTPHPHSRALRAAANSATFADAVAASSMFRDGVFVRAAVQCYRQYARAAQTAAAYERARVRGGGLGEWEGKEAGAQMLEEASKRAETLARRLKRVASAYRRYKHVQ